MQNTFSSQRLLLFFFLIIFLSFSTLLPQTQPPDTLFRTTYGGTNIDLGTFIQPTSDGGYIITGYTRSYGTGSGRNVLLIKTDAIGNAQWIKGYGGNNDDEGNCVRQTADGGFVIAGYTKSYGNGGTDVFLLKTDSLGNELWNKPFGGASDDEGYSLALTADGGCLIAGATSSYGAGSRDVWLVRTDPSGNLLWTKTHGGMSSDGARSIERTSEGGYIITGWSMSYGGVLGDAWLVKTDSGGTQQWQKNFGGTDADRGMNVKQTAEGGYILTGYTASSGFGNDDMYLIKTDALGNSTWLKTYGGTGRDYGNSVEQTADGGFLVLGYTLSFGAGSEDFYLVKTDASGNLVWYKTYGGTASDVGNSLLITQDGSYLLAGYTLSYGAGVHDVWLIKLGSVIPVEMISFTSSAEENNVTLRWLTASERNNMGFEVERNMKIKGVAVGWKAIGFIPGRGNSAEETEYIFIDKNLSAGEYTYRLKQIDYSGGFTYSAEVEAEILQPTGFGLYQNFPNPFNPETVIGYGLQVPGRVRLKLFDVLGNEVATLLDEEKEAGYYNYELRIGNYQLTSGVYFYRLESGDLVSIKKMVVMK